MLSCLKNMNPLSDGSVALGDLHIDHAGPGLFDPTAQYVVASAFAFALFCAGVSFLIGAYMKNKRRRQ